MKLKFMTLALVSTVMVACGSSQGPTTSPTSGQSEATKSADEIWTDAWSDYGKAPAIAQKETETQSSGAPATIQINATPTSMAFTSTANGQVTNTVVVDGKVYLNTGTGFHLAPSDYASAVITLLPTNVASCQTSHGALTKGSTTTVDGHQVIEIKDDGKSPGDLPGSIFVALDGLPHIVEAKGGGVAQTGGRPECAAAPGFSSYESHYNYPSNPSPIAAPTIG